LDVKRTEPPLPSADPGRAAIGCLLLLVAATAAGCASGPPPVRPDPEPALRPVPDSRSAPAITIGGRTLPVRIIKTRRAREEFTLPERPRPSGANRPRRDELWRPPVDRVYRARHTSAVLYAYPDAVSRPLALRDSLGRPLEIVFLDAAGRVLVHHQATLSGRRTVFPSGGAARFIVFLRPGLVAPDSVPQGIAVRLPASAFEDAEPEWVPITDPPPVEIRVNGVPIRVEVAETRDQRLRGLMYRNHVPDGTGMLFVYREEKVLSYWMINTRVPLDLAYIDRDRVIRRICPLAPNDLVGKSSETPVRMALEVPAGWFRRNGIEAGSRLALPDALRSRVAPKEGRDR
jgi:uncharacterized membrane protein (UPF0127 family)